MSIKIMTQAWESPVKGTHKLALLALADYANDNGWCYPSYDTLATKVGVKRRQAFNIIDALVDTGEVWKVPGNEGHSNDYIVVTGQPVEIITERLAACSKIKRSDIPEIVALIMKRRSGVIDCTSATENTTDGVTDCIPMVQPIAPEPSFNRQVETSLSATETTPSKETAKSTKPKRTRRRKSVPVSEVVKEKKPRPRDELFDAISEEFGTGDGQTVALKSQMLGTIPTKNPKHLCNFDDPVTPTEVREFAAWYRKKYRNMTLPTAPEKVQTFFNQFRLTTAKAKEDAQNGLINRGGHFMRVV